MFWRDRVAAEEALGLVGARGAGIYPGVTTLEVMRVGEAGVHFGGRIS